MSDTVWIVIAGIISICIAYGWAFQIGYKRGCRDEALTQAVKRAEDKVKEKMRNENNRI